MKVRASDLRKSLRGAGLDDAEVESIVKGRIEAGACEDDTATSMDTGTFDAALAQLAEGMRGLNKSEMAPPASPPSRQEEYDDGFVDITDLMSGLQKASQDTRRLVSSFTGQADHRHEVMSKGLMVVGKLVEQVAKAHKHAIERQYAIEDKLDTIMKALRMPVAPRSVTGDARIVTSPAEQASEQVRKGGNALTREQVISKAMTELRDPNTDANRRTEVGLAVAELDTHVSPDDVAARYNLH